jgi:peptidoglycan/LPS O-acetylase OafA/YrhL
MSLTGTIIRHFVGSPRLGPLSVGHDNNLNLIRMLLTTSVLISHAVPIAAGMGTIEPLQALLHFSLGGLAVYGFFAISGFLVTQSLMRRAQLVSYIQARALRIFPGLAVALLLTVLVLGPLATSDSLDAYASHRQTWIYFFTNLSLVRLQYGLPGVFGANPYPDAINGSLWTLPMEVSCYIALAVLWRASRLKSGRQVALTGAVVAVFVALVELASGRLAVPVRLEEFAFLVFCFACGSGFYFLRDRIVLNRLAALAALAAVIAVNWFFPCRYLVCIAYFYALFAAGYLPTPLLAAYNRVGDYSYGMYIYAFPVEQLCAWLFPGISPLALGAASFPPVLLLAILSWHIVERPALDLKQKRASAPAL